MLEMGSKSDSHSFQIEVGVGLGEREVFEKLLGKVGGQEKGRPLL